MKREKTVTGAIAPKLINERSERKGLLTFHVSRFTYQQGVPMIKLVFATSNPHKLQEIKDIAGDTNIHFLLPPNGFDPIEDGTTFEENSYIKAKEASKLSGILALADDSGLCVEAPGGAAIFLDCRHGASRGEAIADTEWQTVNER